jgi:hypothetical protein
MLSIATVVTAWSADRPPAGAATRPRNSIRAQVFLLALGGLMLVIGTIVVVTLPQDVGM